MVVLLFSLRVQQILGMAAVLPQIPNSFFRCEPRVTDQYRFDDAQSAALVTTISDTDGAEVDSASRVLRRRK
jgi:hypothetical protein